MSGLGLLRRALRFGSGECAADNQETFRISPPLRALTPISRDQIRRFISAAAS